MKWIIILFPITVWAQSTQWDPNVYIDQVGDNNVINITQTDGNHTTHVALGTNLPSASWPVGITATSSNNASSDNNYVHITQQGTGDKNTRVEISNGYNNSTVILQDGTGNHNANIKNLVGNSNSITINQDGAGNHTINVIGQSGTTNSGNTVDATQLGMGNKLFDLTLAGTSGASVTVTQNNPTQSNTGAMTIQCVTCGSYSYIRN